MEETTAKLLQSKSSAGMQLSNNFKNFIQKFFCSTYK